MVNNAFQAKVAIVRDEDFVLDRSMLSERYWRQTNSQPPSWPDMVAEIAQDPTGYDEFRKLSR
jgi:hypothetical protein